MATAVSPSAVLSSGQIVKLTDLISAALRKAGLPGDVSQQVIENQGDEIAKEFVTGFRKRVEAKQSEIVRRAKPNRALKPMEVIDATGRAKYVDDAVVAEMPKGEGDGEIDVVFFKPDLTARNGYISDDDLDKEFESRGLKPADPYSVAAVNQDDPAFADDHPHGTHWKDSKGKWCFAAFDRWLGERGVDVVRGGYDWYGRWWFAGVRK